MKTATQVPRLCRMCGAPFKVYVTYECCGEEKRHYKTCKRCLEFVGVLESEHSGEVVGMVRVLWKRIIELEKEVALLKHSGD